MGGGNSRELTGTTSGCTAHHTPVRWRLCAVKQLELIPGLLAGLFLLSPGAPVNNCRWASIQWTWDQTDPWSKYDFVYRLRELWQYWTWDQ